MPAQGACQNVSINILSTNNLKRKTISGFIWKFGERILSQFISFAVSIILARLLMPKEYGVIAIAMIFIAISNVLASSGLGTSLVQKKDADNVDFSTMFYSGIVLAIILYIILYIVSPFIAALYKNDLICPVLRVLGISIPISSINSIQQAAVSRKLDFKKFFYATSVGSVLSGICGILMAYSEFGVWALVAQQLSNNIINTLTLNLIVKWRPTLVFSYDRFKELFGFGVKFMFTNLIGTFFAQLKGLIIGVKYTESDLAYYNRGENFPSLLSNNIANSINVVLFPTLAKVQDDRDELKKIIRRSMRTSSFIMCPLLFSLTATADNLVHILLTDEWLPCVPFVQVVSVSYIFKIFSTTSIQSLNAIGRSDIPLKLEFLKKPIYLIIILSAMWISPIVIAIANTVFDLIEVIINTFPNKKYIKYTYREQFVDVVPNFILSAIIAFAILLVGNLHINSFLLLIVQFFLFMCLYLGYAYITKNESLRYIFNTAKSFVIKK